MKILLNVGLGDFLGGFDMFLCSVYHSSFVFHISIEEEVAMAKSKGNNLKRAFFASVPLVLGLLLLLWFTNYSKSTDLQNVLQNLPKEITQSINSAASSQKQDNEILERFEKLTQDLLKKQDEQLKKFDRERKVLEKKIQSLRHPPVHATTREKLALVFEHGATKKFPAYIWQTWPYSDSDERMESTLRTYERNWGAKNPGFVHEIINDDTAAALVHYLYSSVPEVIEAYDALPSSFLRIDFFKYLILLARGGIYADMDTNPLQPIPNWIPENVSPKEIGLVVGIENDSRNPDWRSKYLRRLQFGDWIIQAKPGHPIIREIVAKITENTLKRKSDGELRMHLRNDMNIMGWTGSGVWTDVIFTYFNDYVQSGVLSKITWKDFHDLKVPKLVSDVLIFPQSSFNAPEKDKPKDGSEVKEVDEGNKALHFATHQGMKSWKAAPKVADGK